MKLIGIFSTVSENDPVDKGITSSVRGAYASAIEKSGACPVMLPYTVNKDVLREFIKRCDGFLFTGGKDINPLLYDDANRFNSQICVMRDEAELLALSEIMKTDKPVLGICRGCQLINVALGGSLVQNVDGHRQSFPYSNLTHEVTLVERTPLADIFGANAINVNSVHHQAVKNLGSGLKATAVSPDGVIEAIFNPERRFMHGVQWHPEWSYDTDENSRKLFNAFISVC